MRKIKTPAAAAQAPKAVALDDVRAMLAVVDQNTPEGKRDRALIYFLLDTGCRLGGLISLTVDRLDLDHRRAILIEKGDRARVVPYSLQNRRRDARMACRQTA
jgi:site-specific recombinase XerD